MTPTLRVVLIVVSILTTFMIMRKIRQSKLQIEDSIFWLGFSSILIVFSIFPGLPDLFGGAGGNVHDCQFYLSGGYFPPDCENVPYVDQTVAAGDEGQGSGAEDCAG